MCKALISGLVLTGLLSSPFSSFAQVGPDAALREVVRWDASHQRVADWLSTGLVAGALVAPCVRDRSWRCVGNEALQVGIGVGVSELTKRLTHRRRPNGRDDLSFFSAHTMLACVGTLRTKAWAFCPAVGYLRIASDWHWSTDVMTGAGAGALLTSVSWGR